MSVEFDEQDNFGGTQAPGSSGGFQPASFGGGSSGNETNATGLIGFLVRHGWAQNEATANAILIVIMILSFGLTFLVIFKFIL